MIAKEKYYRGETIGIYVQGDADTDLENNDFIVSFIDNTDIALEFNKAQCLKIQDNEYYIEIENTKTKDMNTGTYKVEIYLGDSYTLIFKDNALFQLEDSHSKKFAV